MEGLLCVLHKAGLCDLAGEEIAGPGIHDVPDPLIVPLLALFLDENGCLITVPDAARLSLVLLCVLSKKLDVLPDPAHRRGLADGNSIELCEVIGDLPEGYPLKEEIQGESDDLRVVLHVPEALVNGEPVTAGFAAVPLDEPKSSLP